MSVKHALAPALVNHVDAYGTLLSRCCRATACSRTRRS